MGGVMEPRGSFPTHPRAARVCPALAAQPISSVVRAAHVRAPWSNAARPRVGFASTSPTTRPHRADGRVPGGRLSVGARVQLGARSS